MYETQKLLENVLNLSNFSMISEIAQLKIIVWVFLMPMIDSFSISYIKIKFYSPREFVVITHKVKLHRRKSNAQLQIKE